jgi:hypothetical protein
MEAAMAAVALPRIQSNQPKKQIHETFSTDATGIFHTLMRIDHIDGARLVDNSVQKPLLFSSSVLSLKAFLLRVLKSLKNSTHSTLLASLF